MENFLGYSIHVKMYIYAICMLCVPLSSYICKSVHAEYLLVEEDPVLGRAPVVQRQEEGVVKQGHQVGEGGRVGQLGPRTLKRKINQ